MERIPTPTISDVIINDFMRPLNLSINTLAKAIHVSQSKIIRILNTNQITPDMSIRLSKYFGVDDGYLLHIQGDLDIRKLLIKHNTEYKQIKPYSR